MKAYRITYYAMIGVFFFAGRLTGRREFFMLFFVMILVALYALFLVLWTVGSFSYVQKVSEKAFVRGKTMELEVGIYNDKPFPFTMMQVEVAAVSPAEKVRLHFSLAEQESVNFSIPIRCAYRGLYRVGMTHLEISDIFGLMRLTIPLERLAYYRRQEIKIFPRIPEFSFLPSPGRDAKIHTGKLKISGEGESLAELRDYRLGDPAKRIHWKQSARRRSLMVKQYEIPLEAGVLVVLDTSDHGYEGEQALAYEDLACECAAAVIMYSLKSGNGVSFLECGGRGSRMDCRSPGDFQKVYERLAVLAFGGKEEAGRLLLEEVRKGGPQSIYVLTRSPSDSLGEAMLRLFRQGCQLRCLHLSPVREQDSGFEDIPTVNVAYGDNIQGKLSESLW